MRLTRLEANQEGLDVRRKQLSLAMLSKSEATSPFRVQFWNDECVRLCKEIDKLKIVQLSLQYGAVCRTGGLGFNL